MAGKAAHNFLCLCILNFTFKYLYFWQSSEHHAYMPLKK
jgi:hypothetical protein